MTAHTSISSPQRAADAGRGLLALLGIAALVAGVPAVLVGWVGSPLPAGVPTVSEVAHAVRDTFVPDAFLVKALALVCWLVWVELLASLLVEAVAYARGRRAATVPLAGGLQRGAARLVAAAALLGAAIATRGGAGPAPLADQPLVVADLAVAPVAVEAGVLPGAGDAGGSGGAGGAGRGAVAAAPAQVVAPSPAGATATSLPTYQVRHRDTLWDIAERHLGDPLRWPEIFQLNDGRPQADGRCLVDPDVIHVGWQLRLPADAAGPAPAGATTAGAGGGMVLIDAGAARPADPD
ncbi:MAG TPA: LysM domain-containing protein [Acidimicrobiales bacterium]|nr:LysM domain-containing protein [Acidimicrobiales bacterium]